MVLAPVGDDPLFVHALGRDIMGVAAVGKRVRCEIERESEWVFMLADC